MNITRVASSVSVPAMTILLAASLAPPAAAQEVAAQAGAPRRASSATEEIVVTAQKRSQDINKVGLTIKALGSATLKERNITTLADIAAAVPGLTYVNSANNTPVYNLRGVGFYETSLGSYPTTSVYLDQVALPFPVLTNLTAFDLQRIEVLKGPQGTLFGQNSTGGAINYIANKPTSTWHYGTEDTYGRWDDFIGSAYASGPLADNLRVRAAVQGENSDPWQHSYTRSANDDGENGRNHNVAGRLLFDWDAASNLKFELNVNGWIDKNQPQAVQYFKFNQQAITNVQLPVRDYPLSPDDPQAADWSVDNGMYRDLHLGQTSLRGDWEFMPGITLTSISSFIGFNETGALDQDGINYDDIDLRYFTGFINSWAQELRLANTDPGARFHWIVGANYSHDRVYYRENIVYGDGSGGNNQVAPYQIESSENYSDQRMENRAVFANGEWNVLNPVTLKAGVRWTESTREADICNEDGTLTPDGGPANRNFPVGGANRLFDLLAGLFGAPNVYPPIQPGGCFNLNDTNPENVNRNNLGPYQAGLFFSSIREHNISWRTGIDYKPIPDILLYVNVSQGFKAGGFGNINAAIDFQFRPVKQENVIDYEGGFKAQLWDHRISFNGSVFRLQYSDKQLRTKDINPIFGIIDALNNIPRSHINGGEVELQVRPLSNLTLGGDATYLDSRIDEYKGINAGGVAANFAGSVIPFTPSWQIGVNARYEMPLTPRLTGFLGGQVSYRTHSFAAVGGSIGYADDYYIPHYAVLDLQAGVNSTAGWRAILWAKNATSSYYWTNVVAGQDQIVRYAQRPASYGITLGYDF